MPTSTLGACVHLLRVRQWVKNILVFIPPLASHQITKPGQFFASLIAFFSFSLAASCIYVINDILDVEHDRAHPTKRFRPIAARLISVRAGVATSVLAGAVAIALAAALLPISFLGLLVVYMVASLTYSARLKQVALVDIFVLSTLYTLRIMAGGAATGTTISQWLFAFSGFFFIGLGMLKRYIEVRRTEGDETKLIQGRGYRIGDSDIISQLGICCGFASAVILALYTTNPDVTQLYQRPHLLWGVCVVEVLWISRIWLLAHRNEVNDDPIVFTLRDRPTYLMAAMGFLSVLSAGPL